MTADRVTDRKPLAKADASGPRWIVRLTDEEHERYFAQAAKFGETRSDWMRRTLAIGSSMRAALPGGGLKVG